MSEPASRAKGKGAGRGGWRHGKSAEQHKAAGTFRPDRHDPDWKPKPKPLDLDDPTEWMAERIGVSPRVAALRPDLADRFELVSPAAHVDRFLRTFCRHTRAVPEGPPLGAPFALEQFQLEFLDDALAVDEYGRRLYRRVARIEPRKNGKTTECAGLALYTGSPADGEHRPEVILAAGSLKQTGKLGGQATAFVNDPLYGSEELQGLFVCQATALLCPSIGGVIQRVAGDGDSNHSLDPHVVVCDELHTWKTPKQRENWKALTTAQGGRVDPLVLVISTEGEGNENELAQLLDRVDGGAAVEKETRSDTLTIWRDRDAGVLVYQYAVPADTTINDLDAFEAANPAPWRTRERIRVDLADRFIDDVSKLRLYGNRRAENRDRWIKEHVWAQACRPDLEIPEGATIVVGADGARTRDTTAIAWAHKREDDKIAVACRVWSTREYVGHHVYVPGRLRNDMARDFIRHELRERYDASLLLFDERYFDDQADDLDDDGMTCIEMPQGSPPMREAWDRFYDALVEGEEPAVVHNGCPVLSAHVAKAVGAKTERGWSVSKKKGETAPDGLQFPIDALAAVVMAWYGAKFILDQQEDDRLLIAII